MAAQAELLPLIPREILFGNNLNRSRTFPLTCVPL
jgi:hypothetical protein